MGIRATDALPESLHEQQPRQSGNGALILTADLRLDNRSDLGRMLAIPDGDAQRLSDSDLLLLAFEAWGEGCVERLLGDFAFAIYDRLHKRCFIARDHFGVRPLYYYYLPNRLFVWSSDPAAILSLSEVPVRVNEQYVAKYLEEIFDDRVETMYQGICRLPPGHCLLSAPTTSHCASTGN
jgi:asparagine synthase (glutamine-hydrolysing)